MAGFLDKETRIIDMVLTGYGKNLLSRGELRFSFWIPFDNEVDYDPYVSTSGSMTDDALLSTKNDHIEATLVEEAKTGYKTFDRQCRDETNVSNPMFTMAHGQRTLPCMTASIGDVAELEIKQQKVIQHHVKKDQFGNTIEELGPFDRSVYRFDASNKIFEYGYTPDSFPSDHQSEGFLVRVFLSGSDGLSQIGERHDERNDVIFGNDLKFVAGKAGEKIRGR